MVTVLLTELSTLPKFVVDTKFLKEPRESLHYFVASNFVTTTMQCSLQWNINGNCPTCHIKRHHEALHHDDCKKWNDRSVTKNASILSHIICCCYSTGEYNRRGDYCFHSVHKFTSRYTTSYISVTTITRTKFNPRLSWDLRLPMTTVSSGTMDSGLAFHLRWDR
jgi:hypothetical protein